jgi:hypothetical protein
MDGWIYSTSIPRFGRKKSWKTCRVAKTVEGGDLVAI